MSLCTVSPVPPSLPFSIYLGSMKNGSQPFFIFVNLLIYIYIYKYFIYFFIFILHFWFSFFNLTQCLWFDLHRHLFLLVLFFFFCCCDYNQEMEIQKSTCYHSKYVLFHLLHTFIINPSPSTPVCEHRPCFFSLSRSLHGFSSRAVFCDLN